MRQTAPVSRKHKRSSSIIQRGKLHASSGYQASIARLDSDHWASFIFNLLDWMTIPSGIEGFEPRYRVLVSRADSDPVGVAEARTLRRARKQMQEVEKTLSGCSHEDARTALDLDV